MRTLYIVLGDQLDRASALDDQFDPRHDALWMAEVPAEARLSWSHKARTAYFFAAMRHFADACEADGMAVIYHRIGEHAHDGLGDALAADLSRHRPERVVWTRPGDARVWRELATVLESSGVAHTLQEDAHFLSQPADFERWARGRKQLRMEYFYRAMRRRHRVLLDEDGAPAGGLWNFDADNRSSFGRDGAPQIPAPRPFPPDAVTAAAIADVSSHFADYPGSLEHFDWPVSRPQALAALDDFIAQRLPHFGDYQDAIWPGEVYLYHSRLSAALNLHLLGPREVIAAAVTAWERGEAPLNAVEGFVRQILGWREYVRGLYWWRLDDWASDNALDAHEDLPAFFWTGETDMACLRDALGQTLEYGYAHHIQRLMVTGLFCLLLGVEPRQVHRWYLSVYVDAVEWVELPNTLGMSQFADGGALASKPYIASGAYINRMSPACASCRYRPQLKTGPRACPYTTLYWDFLIRHEGRLRGNARLRMQFRNLERLEADARAAIQASAAQLRAAWQADSGRG